MFLIVFVTLVLSIMGLFVQVASLQAAKIYRAQTALAQNMLTWHSAATSFILQNQPTWSSNGCSVTPMASLSTSPVGLTFPTVPTPYAACSTMPNITNYLVTGYSTTNYSFYSVAFQSGTPAANYVLTFAYCTGANCATAGGYLYLPDNGGVSTGYTLNDLNAQLTRTAINKNGLVFGVVTALGTLTLPAVAQTTTTTAYAIPSWIPVGAIGIISVGS